MARLRLLIYLTLIIFSCSYNLKINLNNKPILKNDAFMQKIILNSLNKENIINKIKSTDIQFPQISNEKDYIFLRNIIIDYFKNNNMRIFETTNKDMPIVSISIMELHISYNIISTNYFNQFNYFKRCANVFFYLNIKNNDGSIKNIITIKNTACDTLSKELLSYIQTEIPKVKNNIKDKSFLKEAILSSIFILLSIYLFYTDKET